MVKNMSKFGFIGCGNMGGVLCTAVRKSCNDITLFDKDTEKAVKLANTLGVPASPSAVDLVKTSSFIVLGVKPQILPLVLNEIAPVLSARSDRFVIISMAAGVDTRSITDTLGFDAPVIRIMPNTPAEVGKGMILYTGNALVTSEDKAAFVEDFKAAGELDEISENLIDAASAVSGCGPAFVYMFIEALADGGVKAGLPREKALKYAATTVQGAAATVLKTGRHPEALKDAVCSPAGSTIEGVRTLEAGGFRGTVVDAVSESFKRTKELGKK